MYQEAEQGVWKPVLGALGAASVILTLIGNLVFAPKPSLSPTLNLGSLESGSSDAAGPEKASPRRALLAEPKRLVEAAQAARMQSHSDETIVPRPAIPAPVESQNLPCDAASNVLVADQALPTEQKPNGEADAAARPVELSTSPAETDHPVLVAEQTPVVEPAASSEQSVVSQPVLVAPADEPGLPVANASPVSVAACGSQPEANQIAENCELQLPTVAVENSAGCVVVQKLSHYERKMRRKIAHLEKKRSRLFNGDCSLVSR